MATAMTIALDDLDLALLALLDAQARRSNSDLARELGISETAVRKRLARLVDNKALRILPWLNLPRLGLTAAIISMTVELDKIAEISYRLAELPEVFYVGVTTGPADIIVHVVFSSESEFYDFLKQKLAPIEGIKTTQTSIILEIPKFGYTPEALKPARMTSAHRRQDGRVHLKAPPSGTNGDDHDS